MVPPEGAEILEGFPSSNLPRKTDSELLRCERPQTDVSVLKGCGRKLIGSVTIYPVSHEKFMPGLDQVIVGKGGRYRCCLATV